MDAKQAYKKLYLQLSRDIQAQMQLSDSAIQRFSPPLVCSYTYNLLTNSMEDIEGVERLLGYPKEEFTPFKFNDYIYPDDSELLLKVVQEGILTLQQRNTNNLEEAHLIVSFRIRRKNNEYAHLLRVTSVLEHKNGIPIKLLNICVDVTGLNIRPYVKFKLQYSKSKRLDEFDLFGGIISENWFNAISRTERRILRLLSEGKSNEEITQLLSISINTLHTHRRNILRKTGLRTMIQVISKAYQVGYLI